MTFQYPRVNKTKTIEVLQDLIRINNERTTGYQKAIYLTEHLDLTIRDIFEVSISDGKKYSNQLLQRFKQIDSPAKNYFYVPGKIYSAWNDLKVEFAYTNQRAIISSFLYNEEIALYAYKASISKEAGIDDEVIQLLEEQSDGLKENYEQLKSYRKRINNLSASLMHLV